MVQQQHHYHQQQVHDFHSGECDPENRFEELSDEEKRVNDDDWEYTTTFVRNWSTAADFPAAYATADAQTLLDSLAALCRATNDPSLNQELRPITTSWALSTVRALTQPQGEGSSRDTSITVDRSVLALIEATLAAVG